MKPILASQALLTLHLAGSRHCSPFRDRDVKSGDRMPPIQELVLDTYYWGHSPRVAVEFWNWTRLTHLELRNVCVLRFLTTVPPHHLVQLRNLVLDPCCGRTEQPETSDLILALLKKIVRLERLQLKCIVPKVLPGIIKHGCSLHTLELRDLFGSTNFRFSVLSIEEMDSIHLSCPHLMDFGVQLHLIPPRARPCQLQIKGVTLPRMRNVRRLKLFTCIWVGDLQRVENDDYAPVHTTISKWLRWFQAVKQGAPLEIVVLEMKFLGRKQGQGNERTPSSINLTWTYDIRKGPSFGKPPVAR